MRSSKWQSVPMIRARESTAEAPRDGGSSVESPLGSSGRLVGERAGRFYFLAPSQVDYIEADSNYVRTCRSETIDTSIAIH